MIDSRSPCCWRPLRSSSKVWRTVDSRSYERLDLSQLDGEFLMRLIVPKGFGVPAHNVVSIGRTAIGYTPSRSMRNVNPYAKFDGSAPQNFRAYSNVAAFQAPVYAQSFYSGRRGYPRNSVSYAPNPTLRRKPSRFNFEVTAPIR